MRRPDLIRGSGNVYRDFGYPDANLRQARAVIAAGIISVLDRRKLSTRDAERLTGVSHSEFSRIRNTKLDRFTPHARSRCGTYSQFSATRCACGRLTASLRQLFTLSDEF